MGECRERGGQGRVREGVPGQPPRRRAGGGEEADGCGRGGPDGGVPVGAGARGECEPPKHRQAGGRGRRRRRAPRVPLLPPRLPLRDAPRQQRRRGAHAVGGEVPGGGGHRARAGVLAREVRQEDRAQGYQACQHSPHGQLRTPGMYIGVRCFRVISLFGHWHACMHGFQILHITNYVRHFWFGSN